MIYEPCVAAGMALVESVALSMAVQFVLVVLDQEPLWRFDRRNLPVLTRLFV